MFKTVEDNVWAFDLEWVPDPDAGRRVYGLRNDVPVNNSLLTSQRDTKSILPLEG